jgi:hypothetical protein
MLSSFRFQLGTALLLATLATFTHASDAGARPLRLTAFTDAAGGAKVIAGQYDAAITEIRHGKRRSAIDSLPLTNLCVAQIGARDWSEARATCDAAIEAARLDRMRAPVWPYERLQRYKDYVAVAYANRAVLELLSNEVTVAAGNR